jgi:predicted ATP-dependent protease
MATQITHPRELAPHDLRRTVDPASLGFSSTASLPAPDAIVGQERAQEAIAFALAIKDRAYNLYVSGLTGVGRTTAIKRAVAQAARSEPAGQDWLYVYHFDRPGEPMALAMPAGSARAFAHAIDAFVSACRRELRRALTGDVYRQQREAALKAIDTERERMLEYLRRESLARGFVLQLTPDGIMAVPLKTHITGPGSEPTPSTASAAESPKVAEVADAVTAEPITPVEFEALPEEERQRINTAEKALQETIAHTLTHLHELGEEARAHVRELNDSLARRVVAPLAQALLSVYGGVSHVPEYIYHLEADIATHAGPLVMMAREAEAADGGDAEAPRPQQAGDSGGATAESAAGPDLGDEHAPALAAILRRYQVNVLVTQQQTEGAPIVEEINPTFTNLVGRLEFGLRNGLPFTDHLMLKAGACHRANGGYLILHARDLFAQPNAWQALKRTLRFGVISIEDGDEAVALPASASLRPEPIPCKMKAILIGDPQTYALLDALDPEFSELFRVRADFDDAIPHNEASERFYAQFMGDVARCRSLPPLSADAVSLGIEEGGRRVADQGRLSAVLSGLRDLTLEAASVAATRSIAAKAPLTTRADVIQALMARERRMTLAADRIDEMIREGMILIDTSGEVVGQINGLTVLMSGGYAFGKPARITARTAPGLAGIVNIERETMMSGPAHSKGILVLGGYLAGRFAHDQPLSLSATICLEQVYGEIEGDSASSAELYALLSSLSGLPLKQSLAVTGSVNQHGVTQAIGGVNEKIEGFFTLCARQGLTGEHGVIIPRANVRNLMLRQEVIDAVRAGQFHIYAVGSIDEGIEILTGAPAGVADADDVFPPESVNGRVNQTLHEFTRSMRGFSAPPALALPHTASVEREFGSYFGAHLRTER